MVLDSTAETGEKWYGEVKPAAAEPELVLTSFEFMLRGLLHNTKLLSPPSSATADETSI